MAAERRENRPSTYSIPSDPETFGGLFKIIREKGAKLDEQTAARRIGFTVDQLRGLEAGTLQALPTPQGLETWSRTLFLDDESRDELGFYAGHPQINPSEEQERAITKAALAHLLEESRRHKPSLTDLARIGGAVLMDAAATKKHEPGKLSRLIKRIFQGRRPK